MVNHPNRSKRNPSPAANPPPADIIAAREAAGLTQTEAAELVHSALRTWQQWEAEPGTDGHRRMHPAFWELFLIKTAARRA
jgi:DNA-binding transcriptional regulator YiaG